MRLSNSSINKFTECPTAWKYRYVDKTVSRYKSSALYFGSALDRAFDALLCTKLVGNANPLEDPYEVFNREWTAQKNSLDEMTNLAFDTYIQYSKNDLDYDLLDETDLNNLIEEAKLRDISIVDVQGFIKSVQDQKAYKEWDDLPLPVREIYNYAHWLALSNKGHVLIDTYEKKIMPLIKDVLSLQRKVSLDNGEDSIMGYVDLIAKLQDGRVAVLDNKTSSVVYESDSVVQSQQLALYKLILNDMAAKNSPDWNTPIDVAGYLVVNKRLNKDLIKTCMSCGYKAESGATHKTCNFIKDDGKRCNGEWIRKVSFSADTQIIVDTIPEEVQDMILDNVSMINASIKTGIFFRNHNSCKNKYGGTCEYFNKCWKGKDPNLVTKKD